MPPEKPAGRSYGNRFSNANELMNAYGDDRVGGYIRALTGKFIVQGCIILTDVKKQQHILTMYNKVTSALSGRHPIVQIDLKKFLS